MNTNNTFHLGDWLHSTSGQVVLMLLAIAAVYVITEHTSHVLQVLPYALLLMCPLLHLFMHGGHGNRKGHEKHEE